MKILKSGLLAVAMTLQVATANAQSVIAASCETVGTGLVPLSLSFTARGDLSAQNDNPMMRGVVASQGLMFIVFDSYFSNLQSTSDQVQLDYRGNDSNGNSLSGVLTLKTSDDHGVVQLSGLGTLDLTEKPDIGVTLLDQYQLTKCQGIVSL